MPAIYEHYLTVEPSHIDRLGHVNNIEYIKWLQDAATAHSREQGWSSQRYTELGAVWFVRSHHIEYLAQAFLYDSVVVKTWVSSFDKIRSRRRFKIFRSTDQTVLAKAETEWVFVSLERQQPCRVPAELRDAFIVVKGSDEP